MVKPKNYCFTLNNYRDYEIESLKSNPLIQYIVFGYEIAPTTQTPHLQGYIQFKRPVSIETIKKKVNKRMHIEQARGTPEENKKYCTKDGKVEEYGEMVIKGSNTQKLYNQIIECTTWLDVLKIDGIDRRLNYAREVYNNRPLEKMPEIEPRKWQKKLMKILDEEPDDRSIIWIYDKTGGAGKTYLTRYLAHNKDAFVCTPSKGQDIFYAYNNQKIIIYDIPRCIDEQYVNWGTLEKLKDGIVFSGKYNSTTKFRKGNCHLVVFSNHKPPEDKFSKDRIKMMTL